MEVAEDFVKKMMQNGVQLDAGTYYHLLDGYLINVLQEEAENVLEKMKKDGMEPTQEMYDRFILPYVRANKLDRALGILDKMAHLPKFQRQTTYSKLLHALSYHKQHDMFMLVFQRMENDLGPTPLSTQSLLIHDLVRQGLIEDAKKLVKKSPTPRGFASILLYYAHRHMLPEALKIFKTMQLLNCDHAFSYHTLITELCMHNECDHARELFTIMKHKRIIANEQTGSILIRSFLHLNRMDDVVQVLKDMVDMKLDINMVMKHVILRYLINQRLINRASLLIEELKRYGFVWKSEVLALVSREIEVPSNIHLKMNEDIPKGFVN